MCDFGIKMISVQDQLEIKEVIKLVYTAGLSVTG